MVRILRVGGRDGPEVLTAQVFEQLFERHLGAAFQVVRAPLDAFHAQVLGPAREPVPLREAAARFREATAGLDFYCPSWQAIPYSPLLMALRNLSAAPARLLFIAHAAGTYVSEWTLLRPLLRAGDVIVTPSESARRTVELLAPELAPFLRVINHPMSPLPPGEGPSQPRIVSLGRVIESKLVHRQIEALAVLAARRRPLPLLEVAGSLDDDPRRPGVLPYCRGLQEKLRRLDLQDHVRLVGPIRGDAHKGTFLSSASMILCFSVTLEESFPKTPVEALGVGVPVLGTAWNGLRDAVGPCGELLPLSFVGAEPGTPDVSAEAVADGIERLLGDRPPPAACMAWAAQFRPEVVMPRYRAALEGAREAALAAGAEAAELPDDDVPAAPATGLLSLAAPITQYRWREIFDHFAAGIHRSRLFLDGGPPTPPVVWDRLNAALRLATQAPLERFFAGAPMPADATAGPGAGHRRASPGRGDLVERLWAGATSRGLVGGRVACLSELWRAGRHDLLPGGLERLTTDGHGGIAVDYLMAEAKAAAGDLEAAFRLCLERLEASPATEYEAYRVRQLAGIARRWKRPALAIPVLAAWLERFPDAQDAGPTWLDLAVNALRCGDAHLDRSAEALARARTLLGEELRPAPARHPRPWWG